MTFLSVKRPMGSAGRSKRNQPASMFNLELLAKIDRNKIEDCGNMYRVYFHRDDIIKIEMNAILYEILNEINFIAILRNEYDKNIVSFDTEEQAKLYFEVME